MKFDIQSDFFTQQEIEKAIAILDEETKKLDVEIYIFNDANYAKSFLKPFLLPTSYDLLDDKSYGGTMFSRLRENHTFFDFKIFLYEFNVEHTSTTKIQLLEFLFHELRHVYQSVFLTEIMLQSQQQYIHDVNDPAYSEAWIETDANHYSWRILNENKDFLSQLTGYKDWIYKEPQKPCPIEELHFS